MSRTRELLAALMHAQAGGFLAHAPGPHGRPDLGATGAHGVPRPRMWDAVASAQAPGLQGDAVSFVALDDGAIVVEEGPSEEGLEPLADALEKTIAPPYRAAAVRTGDALWSVVAENVEIVELRGIEDEVEVVELTVVGVEREATVDGVRTIRPLAGLDALAAEHGDVALHAERVDGDLFAVDVFPL